MKTKIYLTIVAFAAISMFSGCAKDGDIGPAGPPGPAGSNGNANVYDTTFTFSNWTAGSSYYYVTLDYSKITSTVQSDGAVQVFFSNSAGNTTWYNLTWIYDASTDYYMTYSTQVGKAVVRWQYDGTGLGSDPTTLFTSNSSFKVVVIPSGMRRANVDLTKYQELKAAYNLKD